MGGSRLPAGDLPFLFLAAVVDEFSTGPQHSLHVSHFRATWELRSSNNEAMNGTAQGLSLPG